MGFADWHLRANAKLAVARTPLATETRQSSAALFLCGISAVTVDPMKVVQDAWL